MVKLKFEYPKLTMKEYNEAMEYVSYFSGKVKFCSVDWKKGSFEFELENVNWNLYFDKWLVYPCKNMRFIFSDDEEEDHKVQLETFEYYIMNKLYLKSI